MDPSTRVVVPVVQVLEALPRGVRNPNLVCMGDILYLFIHSFSNHVLQAF